MRQYQICTKMYYKFKGVVEEDALLTWIIYLNLHRKIAICIWKAICVKFDLYQVRFVLLKFDLKARQELNYI